MAKTESTGLTPAERDERSWTPLRLVATGIVTLIVALTIIVSLGSRLGGCGYLDGSHGKYEYDKKP